VFKRVASILPFHFQQSMKRFQFARQIRRGQFRSHEPEFARLGEWVRPGYCVLDIGANVGHYTCRLSELVGPSGRVLAFEPVPATFELLTANSMRFACKNVTSLNVAASAECRLKSMALPKFKSGLQNFYRAQIVDGADISVLSIAIDNLNIPYTVAFAKIDVEGHELQVITGMKAVI